MVRSAVALRDRKESLEDNVVRVGRSVASGGGGKGKAKEKATPPAQHALHCKTWTACWLAPWLLVHKRTQVHADIYYAAAFCDWNVTESHYYNSCSRVLSAFQF